MADAYHVSKNVQAKIQDGSFGPTMILADADLVQQMVQIKFRNGSLGPTDDFG